jgi:hypothetical protein
MTYSFDGASLNIQHNKTIYGSKIKENEMGR